MEIGCKEMVVAVGPSKANPLSVACEVECSCSGTGWWEEVAGEKETANAEKALDTAVPEIAP